MRATCCTNAPQWRAERHAAPRNTTCADHLLGLCDVLTNSVSCTPYSLLAARFSASINSDALLSMASRSAARDDVSVACLSASSRSARPNSYSRSQYKRHGAAGGTTSCKCRSLSRANERTYCHSASSVAAMKRRPNSCSSATNSIGVTISASPCAEFAAAHARARASGCPPPRLSKKRAPASGCASALLSAALICVRALQQTKKQTNKKSKTYRQCRAACRKQ